MLGKSEIKNKIRSLLEKVVKDINLSINGWCLRQQDILGVKEIEIEDNYIIVRLEGALDASTIPIVKKQQKKHKNQFDKHIIIDFYDVEHIDCAILAMLVNLFMELKSNSRKLVIVNATEQLMGYTKILRLQSVINIFPDEKTAVASLSCT